MSTRATTAEPSISRVAGLSKERTTALTAPLSPSQLLFPPAAVPELSVVSDFSKPILRSPPSAISAPAVPSVVMLVMVAPSAATLIDQACTPPSVGLFEVVNTQSRDATWTEPASAVRLPSQEPSNERSRSCARQCPAKRTPTTAARARKRFKYISLKLLSIEAPGDSNHQPLETEKWKSPQCPSSMRCFLPDTPATGR